MSYLFVVAHPDDEVLGGGATIAKLAEQGLAVSVCIMVGDVKVRQNRPTDEQLEDDILSATDALGVKRVIAGNFPNIALNTVEHLKLVQFIEQAIVDTEADVVITHHPSDLNNDHFHTSIACQAAVRLFQRRSDVISLKELLYMEVPSSTEWGLNPTVRPFSPNVFVEVGEELVDKKIVALSCYRGVMHPYPHPRSKEAIKGLAACRGAQAGQDYSEAFESIFRRVSLL